ncbi:putative hydroxyacylglutathione hydrolase [Serratia symbiotica str. 'Cinara cedri']|nr:putative hydroxyacylglutathione hydrolase [Serratia symbiotica str. 'Cinara cedri']
MNLISIPALKDNYIWLLNNKDKHCVIIDPGEAAPVLNALQQLKIIPDGILLTHHHHDHVGGVDHIISHYPNLPVYGPQETAKKGANHIIDDAEKFAINGRQYITLSLTGHTLNHVAFYSAPYLFCGDTIFSAGCGRIFEGTPKQMYHSFQKIAQLPDNTLICCAHEYTLSNLNFARNIIPEDKNLKIYQQYIKTLRARNQPSIPTTLQLERQINLFLRCHDYTLQKKLGFNLINKELDSVFCELRIRKDNF